MDPTTHGLSSVPDLAVLIRFRDVAAVVAIALVVTAVVAPVAMTFLAACGCTHAGVAAPSREVR